MRKMKWLMFAGLLVACVYGGWTWKSVTATPSKSVTTTIVAGPVLMGEWHVKGESELNKIKFKSEGISDLYVVHNKVAPGGHTGWHSHPGISFVMVKSGTATEYHGDDPNPTVYQAGTSFMEEAGHPHLIVNEGTTDLELVAFQIIPFGALRRIDEPAP